MKLLKITLTINAVVAFFFATLSVFYPEGMIENYKQVFSIDLAFAYRTAVPNTFGIGLLMWFARSTTGPALKPMLIIIISTWLIAAVLFLWMGLTASNSPASIFSIPILSLIFVPIYIYSFRKVNRNLSTGTES